MAQHKLTSKELQALAASLGVDVELVDDETLSDIHTTKGTDAAVTLDTLIKSVDGSRKPIIEQDLRSSLEADINKHVAGKTTAAVRKEIATLTGIPADQLEGKDRKEAMQIALAHYSKTLGVDKESAAEQLQQVMAAKDKEIETERQARSSDKQNFDKQIASYGINSVLAGLYADAKGIPPTADKKTLQGDFKDWLEKNYHVTLTEDQKSLALYNAKEPAKLAMNEAGTQVLKLQDVQKEYHKARNQWFDDNRSINPATLAPKGHEHTIRTDKGEMLTPLQQSDAALDQWLGQS